eukprot:COSAG06_NODE_5765_length_3284_cov_14.119623_1_plen_187_part_00
MNAVDCHCSPCLARRGQKREEGPLVVQGRGGSCPGPSATCRRTGAARAAAPRPSRHHHQTLAQARSAPRPLRRNRRGRDDEKSSRQACDRCEPCLRPKRQETLRAPTSKPIAYGHTYAQDELFDEERQVLRRRPLPSLLGFLGVPGEPAAVSRFQLIAQLVGYEVRGCCCYPGVKQRHRGVYRDVP